MNLAAHKLDVPTVPLDFAAKGPLRFRVRSVLRSKLRMIEVDYSRNGAGDHAEFPRLEHTYTIGVRLLPEASKASVHGKVFNFGSPSGYTHCLYLGGVDLVELNTQSHTIELLLPQSFMREITEDLGVSAVTHLGNDACFIRPDPVIPRMVQHMRPFFDDPGSLETLQADSFMWAFAIYVMSRYGELESHRPHKGGLTTWQERLAKDWIEAVLPGGTTLSELASACGIGVSHFAHAFRRTTGVSPYQWLVQRRVERAKELLKFSLPLSDIALACGFSDQSHMTRTFKRATGLAPRTWQLTQQIRVSDSR